MAEQKHTPGQWYWTETTLLSDAERAPVLTTHMDGRILGNTENKTLIAAAPDLLEALRSVVNAYGLDMQAAWVGMGRSGECHELVAARAAIAKAEGK
jgi:antitoxin component HigA of HigAB toxin-antitoxin module